MSEETIDYPKGLTFEQVWAGIQELGKKYDAIFEREAKERQERQERQEREAKERQEREEREAKERQAYQKAEAERRKEADERMKKLEKVVENTNRAVSKTDKKLGHLDKRFGEIVEQMLAPNIAERFNELGYHFDGIFRGNFEIRENDQVVTEVDILLENEKTIAIVEIKSKPDKRDIKKHLKRMQIVRRYYERHGNTDKELIGAVAGVVFPNDVKQFTIETGFYVIIPSGDSLKIDVPEDFKPQIF